MEEQQVPISQLQARRVRVEPPEPISPLAMVELKGKSLETPSNKPKKIKKTNASTEGAPKKAKLLTSAMFAARTAKVYLKLLFN